MLTELDQHSNLESPTEKLITHLNMYTTIECRVAVMWLVEIINSTLQ